MQGGKNRMNEVFVVFAAISWIFSLLSLGVAVHSYRMNYLMLSEYFDSRLTEAEARIYQQAVEEACEIVRKEELARTPSVGPKSPMDIAGFNRIEQ